MDQPAIPFEAPAPDSAGQVLDPMPTDDGYGEVPLGVECAWPDRQ
jgi:hypothetical protein